MRKWSGADIAFVIPTKDRAEKIKNTLSSLARQSEKCGHVVVVASGQDIAEVIRGYAGRLNVEYYYCATPGQMRQRNIGISHVPSEARLVGFLDDDIVLDPAAIHEIIKFWNKKEPDTAGIAFNIVEQVPCKVSLRAKVFRGMFQPGRVYKSGFSTPFIELDHSIRTQRLNGGATIWRRAILAEFPRRQIDAPWAICEDLIFSYPIGKKYPLYVCADARVVHDHAIEASPTNPHHRRRGRVWALWQLYFVTLNCDLSIVWYVATALVLSVFGMIVGVCVPERGFYRRFYFGVAEGAIRGLAMLLRQEALEPVLKEDR